MINFVFFLLFILFLVIFYKSSRTKPSLPKGVGKLPRENGLPIIGIFHQIKSPFCIHFANLGKKLGPIFEVRLGMRDIVLLNNYDVIKKTLKDDGDTFAGRFKIRYFKEITRGVGILFNDGEMWSKQRAFIQNFFREFGVNTSRYVNIIQEECSSLLRNLEQRNETETNFSNFSTTFIANIISKFVLSKRFDLGSEEMKDLDKFLLGIAKSKSMFQILSLMYPLLDKSTLFFKLITLFSFDWKVSEKMHKYYQGEVKKRLEKLNFNSEGEDLIDQFLIKQKEMKTKTGNVDSFTTWQLIRNIIELFVAGYETLSTTLNWSLMFISKFPEIQNKVHSEIMDKIGNKEPSMNDKVLLSYTQAVMDEIHRKSSALPLAFPHQTLKDSIVDGFFIRLERIDD